MIFNLKLFHFYPAFFFKFNIIVFKISSYSSFTVIKILQFESGDSCKSGVNEGDGARHFRCRGSLRLQKWWEFCRPASRLPPSAEIN